MTVTSIVSVTSEHRRIAAGVFSACLPLIDISIASLHAADADQPIINAHPGVSGYLPEHTLEFESLQRILTVEAKVDGVVTDFPDTSSRFANLRRLSTAQDAGQISSCSAATDFRKWFVTAFDTVGRIFSLMKLYRCH